MMDTINPMKGKRKAPKVPGFMRAVLAQNVKNLMEHHYSNSANRTKALAKDAGVSLSTVQRIIAAEVGASLDNIEALAACFEMSVYQVLIPSISASNPQIVQGATKEEERLYRNWKRTGKAVPEEAHDDVVHHRARVVSSH